jgi:hypothetical protein
MFAFDAGQTFDHQQRQGPAVARTVFGQPAPYPGVFGGEQKFADLAVDDGLGRRPLSTESPREATRRKIVSRKPRVSASKSESNSSSI